MRLLLCLFSMSQPLYKTERIESCAEKNILPDHLLACTFFFSWVPPKEPYQSYKLVFSHLLAHYFFQCLPVTMKF